MNREEATSLLRDVEKLRSETRVQRDSAWLGLLGPGAVLLASVPVHLTAASLAPAYWLLAFGVYSAVMMTKLRRSRSRFGPALSRSFIWAMQASFVAGGALALLFIPPIAPHLAIATGYLPIAWHNRSKGLAVIAVFLAAAAVTSVLLMGSSAATAGLVCGCVLLAAGVVSYRSSSTEPA